MDIKRAHMIARDLISYYLHSDYSQCTLEFTDSKQRFGVYIPRRHLIRLSEPLTILNSEEQFIDTVLHEIAHALTPYSGHNIVWRKKAQEIGCTGERTYGSTVITPQKKYQGRCPNCNQIIYRHRRKRISCGKCSGGSFNARYLFTWKEN